MKTIYLDCSAGIAGDMTVGALIDLGTPLDVVRDGLGSLRLPSATYTVDAEKTLRKGIAATHFRVNAIEERHHRHYGDIVNLIDESALAMPVKVLSHKVFKRLAEAESLVHSVLIEKVHFHEVGAIDSIVDIVGVAICLDYLGVEELHASSLPYGRGWIESAHGRIPVPAPATVELMKGLSIVDDPLPGEWVTPTGAAIVAALAVSNGKAPALRVTAVGHGAGSKDPAERPNLLRLLLGDSIREVEEIVVVETNLDDVNPEILGFLMERLISEGALDVSFSSLQMKKNRPGIKLTVIAQRAMLDALSSLILSESGAIGLRYYPVERMTLERSIEKRTISLGAVNVKQVRLPNGTLRITPEYEECRRLAVATGLPLLEVYRIVERETSQDDENCDPFHRR